MSGSPALPLQGALYTLLDGHVTGLNGQPVRCRDGYAAATPMPYLLLGEPTARDDSPKTDYLWQATRTLLAYSNYAGQREVLSMLGQMTELLQESEIDLTAEGWTVKGVTVERVEAFRDLDGAAWHGVLRVRCFVQDTGVEPSP